MPTLPAVLLNRAASSGVADVLKTQWKQPSDILSVLLILGPDIVQRAVAQLAGRNVTPVAFSFGWVAHAAQTLLHTFGDGRLMPEADMANTCVVGAATGHIRNTSSWVLGRLLRDEDARVDDAMIQERAHVPPGQEKQASKQLQSDTARPEWEALRVTVYDVEKNPPVPHGVPTLDIVWYSGFVVIIVQIAVSIIPWVVDGDWAVFLITVAGNALALAGASLPQWCHEKWACPKPYKGGSTVTITQGNGSRHATVILARNKVGLDFEILALGTRTTRPSIFTRIASIIMALLWIMLLISVSGLNESSWYLLGIGLLGSIQNLHAAGTSREPTALGIHLTHLETLRGKSVAKVLRELEEKYPSVGTSLLPVFFPGSLRAQGDDLLFWRNAIAARTAPNRFGAPVDGFPTTPEKGRSGDEEVEEVY